MNSCPLNWPCMALCLYSTLWLATILVVSWFSEFGWILELFISLVRGESTLSREQVVENASIVSILLNEILFWNICSSLYITGIHSCCHLSNWKFFLVLKFIPNCHQSFKSSFEGSQSILWLHWELFINNRYTVNPH